MNPRMKPVQFLEGTRVPNLDAMGPDDLGEFHTKHHGGRNFRDLFLDARGGSRDATKQLANYAVNKMVAMDLRQAGHVERALEYERICQTIYQQLPTWARW